MCEFIAYTLYALGFYMAVAYFGYANNTVKELNFSKAGIMLAAIFWPIISVFAVILTIIEVLGNIGSSKK